MPTANEVYQVAQRFETALAGDEVNVFDLLVASGTCTDAELLTALGTWVQTAYGQLLAQIHNTVSIQEGKVNQMIWNGVKWVVYRYVGMIYPSLTFTNASEALPHATSALAQFPTVYPRVVGKKYLPTFGESEQNGSALTGTALAQVLSYGSVIMTPLTPGGATLQYRICRKDGTTALPFAYVANGTISSQKRRKPGVGS